MYSFAQARAEPAAHPKTRAFRRSTTGERRVQQKRLAGRGARSTLRTRLCRARPHRACLQRPKHASRSAAQPPNLHDKRVVAHLPSVPRLPTRCCLRHAEHVGYAAQGTRIHAGAQGAAHAPSGQPPHKLRTAYMTPAEQPARFPSPAACTLVPFASSTQPTGAPNTRDTRSAYNRAELRQRAHACPVYNCGSTRGKHAGRRGTNGAGALAVATHMTPRVRSPRRRAKSARNGVAAYTRVTRNDAGPHDTERRGEAWSTRPTAAPHAARVWRIRSRPYGKQRRGLHDAERRSNVRGTQTCAGVYPAKTRQCARPPSPPNGPLKETSTLQKGKKKKKKESKETRLNILNVRREARRDLRDRFLVERSLRGIRRRDEREGKIERGGRKGVVYDKREEQEEAQERDQKNTDTHLTIVAWVEVHVDVLGFKAWESMTERGAGGWQEGKPQHRKTAGQSRERGRASSHKDGGYVPKKKRAYRARERCCGGDVLAGEVEAAT
ncbi:hypothetical protein C8J57DRAFT_1650058 [Mycena rebaudengoi]|nr:hypothetical protein C8J57DRAFT_1650058 [Mycena rebaudengoi]